MVLARGQILGSQKGAARPHSGAGRAFLRCHSTCCIAANGRGERPAPGCAARRRLCAGGQLRPGGPTKPSRRSLGSGCRFGLSPSRQSATQPGCSHQRPVLPLGVDKEEEGQKERERERERESVRTLCLCMHFCSLLNPSKALPRSSAVERSTQEKQASALCGAAPHEAPATPVFGQPWTLQKAWPCRTTA